MGWYLGRPERGERFTRTGDGAPGQSGLPRKQTPSDGVEGGREGSCPDPAAESEKLIMVRRPEMHPTVIEPSGTRLLGKEATSTYQAALCNVGYGWSVSVVPNGPPELKAGKDSNLQARGQANSQLPE